MALRRSARQNPSNGGVNAGALVPAPAPAVVPANPPVAKPKANPKSKKKSVSNLVNVEPVVAAVPASSQDLERANAEKAALQAKVAELEAQLNPVPASHNNAVQENSGEIEAQEGVIDIPDDDGDVLVQNPPSARGPRALEQPSLLPKVTYKLPPPELPAELDDPEMLDEHLRQLDVYLKTNVLKPGQYVDILLSTVQKNRKIRQWLLRYAADFPLCTKEQCLSEFRHVFLSHMRNQTEVEHHRLFAGMVQQNVENVAFYNSEFRQCVSRLTYLDQHTLIHFYHLGLHPTIRQQSRVHMLTGEPHTTLSACMDAAIAVEKLRLDQFRVKRPALAHAPFTNVISSFYSSQEKFRQQCSGEALAQSPAIAPATPRNAKRQYPPSAARAAEPACKRAAAATGCNPQPGPSRDSTPPSHTTTGPPKKPIDCWHCGKLGHRQANCHEFKAKMHNGSTPRAARARARSHTPRAFQDAVLMMAHAFSQVPTFNPTVAAAAPTRSAPPRAPTPPRPPAPLALPAPPPLPAPPALVTKHSYQRAPRVSFDLPPTPP